MRTNEPTPDIARRGVSSKKEEEGETLIERCVRSMSPTNLRERLLWPKKVHSIFFLRAIKMSLEFLLLRRARIFSVWLEGICHNLRIFANIVLQKPISTYFSPIFLIFIFGKSCKSWGIVLLLHAKSYRFACPWLGIYREVLAGTAESQKYRCTV